MSQSNQFVVASPPTLLHVIDIYIGDYDDDKNDHNDDDDENKLAKARKMRKPPGTLSLNKFGLGNL